MKCKIVCILLCFQLLFINSAFSAGGDYIVVIVNDDIITQSELDNSLTLIYMQMSQGLEGQELETEFDKVKDDILLRMVEDRLILHEARRQGLEPNEAIVQGRLEEFKSEFHSQEEFNSFLTDKGMSIRDIKERFRDEILMKGIINKEVKSKIIINPQDITDYYKENLEEFQEREGLEVDSVSVAVEQGEEFLNDYEVLNDFHALGEKYGKSEHGIVVRRGEFREEIEDAIYSLEINEATEPLEIGSNIYVFRLIGKVEGFVRPLSEVQEYISAVLMDNRMRIGLTEWIKELTDSSYVVIK